MFLQQLHQQQQSQETSESQVIPQVVESPKLKRSRGVTRLSIYGFWFLTGIAIANLSRFLPHGWILYWVAVGAVAGYLLFAPSEETEEALGTRRLAGVALALSCVSFWDALITVLTLPIHIFNWILPVWLVGLLAIVALILLVIGLSLIS